VNGADLVLEVDDLEWVERDHKRAMAGLPPEPSDPALFAWFEDLRLRPELLQPPPVVIPRLAWQGRLTVLASAEKVGKSTLAGQGVAAMQTSRAFLHGIPASGKVFWACLDEPAGDLVQRLESFGARGGVAIRDLAPTEEELQDIVEEVQPVLIVIDSLTEYLANRRVESVYDPIQVQRALAPLRNLARRTATAVLFLHHVTKATGRSADSRQIGAMADVIIEMKESPGEPTEREIECRGRGMPAEYRKYRLRYEESAYQLVGGSELPLEARVLLAVQGESGLSKARIRDKVGGRRDRADDAIATLENRGAIVNLGTPKGAKYYPALEDAGRGGAGLGRGSGRGSEEPPNSLGGNDGRGPGAVVGRASPAPSIEGEPGRGAPGDPTNGESWGLR
jgi:hypothetical protein